MEELTVRDNLLLWHRGNKKQMNEDLKTGSAALWESCYAGDESKLSGGMKKRLSIACALSGNAPVLIMDEPGAALDLECKESIRQYLKGYVNEGKTVILTSHEMEELSLCDRLYVMKDRCLKEIEAGLSSRELIHYF